MIWIYGTVTILSSLVLSFAATGLAYALLKRFNVMDHPVERSNHTVPTPRGGGLGMMTAVLGFLIVVNAPTFLTLSVLVLAAVSFLDDLKPLAPKFRLGVQAVLVICSLWGMYHLENSSGRVFLNVVPIWMEAIILGLGWMWFINLFNFMDGSDGIAASEASVIAAGLLLLSWIVDTGMDTELYAMIILGSAVGFALWNWHPAKIFMGDAGSIPMGYVLGFVLIELARHGWWAAALILPAYFVADATFVLVQRGLRGEKFWIAHSQHAYQKALRRGMSHDEVARWVIALGVLLWVLAAISTLGLTCAIICTILAYLSTFVLMVAFKRGGAGLPQAA